MINDDALFRSQGIESVNLCRICNKAACGIHLLRLKKLCDDSNLSETWLSVKYDLLKFSVEYIYVLSAVRQGAAEVFSNIVHTYIQTQTPLDTY